MCVGWQGMSLVPAVTELMLAEMLYLQYDNPTRPIFMYINSAGVQVRELPLSSARGSFENLDF
jgi:ATP-dependent protease ClpP protease subunit